MPGLDKPGIACAALAALTLVGVAVARSGAPALAADGILLVLAAAKARIVCLDFLGLRSAPPAWRRGLALGVGFVAFAALIGAAVTGMLPV
jgi:hypothetical protein